MLQKKQRWCLDRGSGQAGPLQGCFTRSRWWWWIKLPLFSGRWNSSNLVGQLTMMMMKIILLKKKTGQARVCSILIARLNSYTPNKSKITQNLTCCKRFSVQGLQNSGAHKNRSFLGFFHGTAFPDQTVNFRLKHVYISWKLSVDLRYLGTLYLHPVTHQIFVASKDRSGTNSWNIVLWVKFMK